MALPRSRLVSPGQARAPAGTEVLPVPTKPQQNFPAPRKVSSHLASPPLPHRVPGLVGGCDFQLGRLSGSGAPCFSLSHWFPSVTAAAANVLREETALSTQAASHKSTTEEEGEEKVSGKEGS